MLLKYYQVKLYCNEHIPAAACQALDHWEEFLAALNTEHPRELLDALDQIDPIFTEAIVAAGWLAIVECVQQAREKMP